MEPVTRLAFEYPIYGMDFLDNEFLVVAGGGGRMKSGIPNACEVVSFNEASKSLTRIASVSLPDAPVALATNALTTTLVIGSGCKNFKFKHPKAFTPTSSFEHDLRVHKNQEQSAIAISASASHLAVASDEGHLIVVKLPHYDALFSKRVHTQGVTDLSITTDGQLLATTARDRTAFIIQTHNGQVLEEVGPVMPKEMRTHVRAIRFSPSDPNLIFTAESNPRKGAWIAARRCVDFRHGGWTPIASIRASSDALTAFTLNETATIAAVSSSEGHIALFRWNGMSFSRMWTTEPGSTFFRPPTPPHVLPITAMRFSSSGTHLLTASADYTVAVWSTKRPINYRRIFRGLFWTSSCFVLLFAMLVAEEHHLPAHVQTSRARVQPYLEPHLSQLQDTVRPQIREGVEYLQPHLDKLRDAAEPHVETLRVKAKPLVPVYEKVRNDVTPVINRSVGMVKKISVQLNTLREQTSAWGKGVIDGLMAKKKEPALSEKSSGEDAEVEDEIALTESDEDKEKQVDTEIGERIEELDYKRNESQEQPSDIGEEGYELEDSNSENRESEFEEEQTYAEKIENREEQWDADLKENQEEKYEVDKDKGGEEQSHREDDETQEDSINITAENRRDAQHDTESDVEVEEKSDTYSYEGVDEDMDAKSEEDEQDRIETIDQRQNEEQDIEDEEDAREEIDVASEEIKVEEMEDGNNEGREEVLYVELDESQEQRIDIDSKENVGGVDIEEKQAAEQHYSTMNDEVKDEVIYAELDEIQRILPHDESKRDVEIDEGTREKLDDTSNTVEEEQIQVRKDEIKDEVLYMELEKGEEEQREDKNNEEEVQKPDMGESEIKEEQIVSGGTDPVDEVLYFELDESEKIGSPTQEQKDEESKDDVEEKEEEVEAGYGVGVESVGMITQPNDESKAGEGLGRESDDEKPSRNCVECVDSPDEVWKEFFFR